MYRSDIDALKQHIQSLLAAHPELLDDNILRSDMLEGETDLHRVLSHLIRRLGETEVQNGALKAYIAELHERKERLVHRMDVIRSTIKSLMESAQLTKVELPEALLTVSVGQPKVIIVDEEKIPDGFMRIKREPDKVALRAYLASVGTIDGATLSNRETVLTVRK